MLDLTWFLSTVLGGPFAGAVNEAEYQLAFALAENELREVKCNCASLYEAAMSIKIALILSQLKDMTDSPSTTANPVGDVAMVKRDKVYDTEREYVMVKQAEQIAGSRPAEMLAGIIARCKTKLKIGAVLAVGLGNDCGCGSGSGALFADKSDGITW